MHPRVSGDPIGSGPGQVQIAQNGMHQSAEPRAAGASGSAAIRFSSSMVWAVVMIAASLFLVTLCFTVDVALTVAGSTAEGVTELSYPHAYRISYPEFLDHMNAIGIPAAVTPRLPTSVQA